MRQFVADDVIGLAEAGRKRHHDARLEALGEPAGPLVHRPGADVGLREVAVARVEHDRLAMRELMIEQLREARVPPLGHPRRLTRHLLLFRVVIDVEVLGVQRLELQAAVLDLIPAEVLRACRRGQKRQGRRGKTHEYRRGPEHGAPLSWSWRLATLSRERGRIDHRHRGVSVA